MTPFLALVVDVVDLRTHQHFRAFVGSCELGGYRDSRFHIVTGCDAAVRRQLLDIPLCLFDVDARFGFDAGWRCRIMLQAHRAALRRRD